MELTITINRARLAALREDLRVSGDSPSESGIDAHAEVVVLAALDALRDRYRTDAIRPQAFIRRFPPAKYAAIVEAAEASPELADYLERLDDAPYVWLGSPETQGGIAALVALGLLTQGEADDVLFIALPELPA
jgi:hypothetical protein